MLLPFPAQAEQEDERAVFVTGLFVRVVHISRARCRGSTPGAVLIGTTAAFLVAVGCGSNGSSGFVDARSRDGRARDGSIFSFPDGRLDKLDEGPPVNFGDSQAPADDSGTDGGAGLDATGQPDGGA